LESVEEIPRKTEHKEYEGYFVSHKSQKKERGHPRSHLERKKGLNPLKFDNFQSLGGIAQGRRK
jgi:hypothetical protein